MVIIHRNFDPFIAFVGKDNKKESYAIKVSNYEYEETKEPFITVVSGFKTHTEAQDYLVKERKSNMLSNVMGCG